MSDLLFVVPLCADCSASVVPESVSPHNGANRPLWRCTNCGGIVQESKLIFGVVSGVLIYKGTQTCAEACTTCPKELVLSDEERRANCL